MEVVFNLDDTPEQSHSIHYRFLLDVVLKTSRGCLFHSQPSADTNPYQLFIAVIVVNRNSLVSLLRLNNSNT